MLKVLILKGIPGSGKSFFAKQLMREEPGKWKRLNFDDLRNSLDAGVYSPANEKIIIKIRDLAIQEALKNGINCIVDNTHIKDKGRHFDHICSVVKALGIDIMVIEKPIYCDIEIALERDANRENPVGKNVIEGFWKASGGKQFAHYVPKVETFYAAKSQYVPVKQNEKADRAIICDLDGSLAIFAGKRSPYDATECENDDINPPVAETVKLYHRAGYKIIFCSGREEKYREPTTRFIEKHLPEMEYKLFMRASLDKRKDSIVKEEIYRNEIEGKYFVHLILDDRTQVVDQWRSLGLTCFQVAPGDF